MEVILLEPVHKLGDAGQIVNVKKGYARNFLIPQGKVLLANNQNKAEFESRKAEIEKENKAKSDVANSLAKKVDNKFVVVIRQAGEDGRLFGSVSARDIADVIVSDLKVEVKRNQVALHKPIKYVGIYTEDVILHGNVTAKLNVNVARTQDEAAENEKEFLNPTKKEEKQEFEVPVADVAADKNDESKVEENAEETIEAEAK